MNITNRGPLGPKEGKPKNGTAAGKRHMGRVKMLPCVICGRPPPSDAHHCRSNGQLRDDFKTIPLCKDCHQGQNGYHNAKETWEAENGPDTDYLETVKDMLAGEYTPLYGAPYMRQAAKRNG